MGVKKCVITYYEATKYSDQLPSALNDIAMIYKYIHKMCKNQNLFIIDEVLSSWLWEWVRC